MSFRGRNQSRPQKRCWCGSGKKEKNCHGRQEQRAAGQKQTVAIPSSTTNETRINAKPLTLPGEEQRVIVAPVFKESQQNPPEINLHGLPGPYRVQFLLGRPGYPATEEREYRFIDEIIGTSHVRIAKAKSERGLHDVDHMRLDVAGKNFQILAFPNQDGFLGKLVAELQADSATAAEQEVYGAISPFLSAWSMNADIPIHIETIQVTELKTFISALRINSPHLEMNIAGGQPPLLQEDFCHYASIYREGLNTSSPFYRFLCFYKIIESVIAKRGREAQAKKAAGQDPRRPYEVIPENTDDIRTLLKRLYPWQPAWEEFGLSQMFPQEVRGKKVTVVRDNYLRPLRLGIAHALLDRGEITVILDKMEQIGQVNKWLPLCRICARWMLLSDFPRECALAMK